MDDGSTIGDLPLLLPAEAPLSMPPQCFRTPYRDPIAPALRVGFAIMPVAVFIGVLVLTGLAAREMLAILRPGGLTLLEIALAVLFTLTFVGIAIGCVTAMFGAGAMIVEGRRRQRTGDAAPPISVALLVLTYNEDPEPVFANVVAMARDLARHQGRHWYSIYILSDTTDRTIAAREVRAHALAREAARGSIPIHYRHRAANTDKKVGNLRDWCTRWGGHHDGMMVLDADSLMSGEAIVALSDALSEDPGAGLVQTVPQIAGDRTVFQRLQAFTTAFSGAVFANGLARWVGGSSNYWGHNAILRTRAFAAAAGLPHLSGPAPFGGLLMSHDFVEAALIRRAGWRVVLRPDIEQSYEEAPATLSSFVERDARWCQGNMQHMRLLTARGFHPISRFHLVHGIMSYLAAPLWAVFLMIGAVIALQGQSMPIDYFPDPYALFPTWPVLDSDRALTLLIITLGVLLAPKLAGLLVVLRFDPLARRWGGWHRLVSEILIETLVAALTAPILMVHQCRAIVRMAFGRDGGWRPLRQSEGRHPSLAALARFHAFETGLGISMLTAIAYGVLTPLVLPIAFSLALAVPLSALLSMRLGSRFNLWAASPDRRETPTILTSKARSEAALRDALADRVPDPATLMPQSTDTPVVAVVS